MLNWTRLIAIVCTTMVICASADAVEPGSESFTSLSLRVQYDSNACPATVQIYLDQTSDTLGGFEITLMWDQPGIINFQRAQLAVPKLDEHSTDNPQSVLAPKVYRDNGLVKNWNYVEARGDSGHWVKVTGLSSLMAKGDSLLIVPGDQGVLFELPLAVDSSSGLPTVGDSLGLIIQSSALRLSTSRGTLARNIRVQNVILPIPPCHKLEVPH